MRYFIINTCYREFQEDPHSHMNYDGTWLGDNALSGDFILMTIGAPGIKAQLTLWQPHMFR